MSDNIVICDYVRTPFTKATTPKKKGVLADVYPNDMEAALVKSLLKRTGIDPKTIEDVITGTVFQEGAQGLNDGRNVVLHPDSGLPISVPGSTVNRFCGSSMEAIHIAAGKIAMGAGDAIIVTGVEVMSHNPRMIGYMPMLNPKIYEAYDMGFMSAGIAGGENIAKKYDISRALQEEFAVKSHKKAAAAQSEGKLDNEIVPIETPEGTVSKDDMIRPDSSIESLAKLPPSFAADGTVTAATSSPFTDGASAVLVTSEAFAKENNLPILARIVSTAVSACEPEIMGVAPVGATKKALKRAGLTLDDIDIVELNEAFAAQSVAVLKELGLDESKVNIDGGALAIGHPLGASGARLTGKVASLLQREGKRYGLATMCIGGGMGVATILERYEP